MYELSDGKYELIESDSNIKYSSWKEYLMSKTLSNILVKSTKIEYNEKYENIMSHIPTIINYITEASSEQKPILGAVFDPAIKRKLDDGVAYLKMSKKKSGEFTSLVFEKRNGKEKLIGQARLKEIIPETAMENFTVSMQYMVITKLLIQILEKFQDIEEKIEAVQIELHNDRIAMFVTGIENYIIAQKLDGEDKKRYLEQAENHLRLGQNEIIIHFEKNVNYLKPFSKKTGLWNGFIMEFFNPKKMVAPIEKAIYDMQSDLDLIIKSSTILQLINIQNNRIEIANDDISKLRNLLKIHFDTEYINFLSEWSEPSHQSIWNVEFPQLTHQLDEFEFNRINLLNEDINFVLPISRSQNE